MPFASLVIYLCKSSTYSGCVKIVAWVLLATHLQALPRTGSMSMIIRATARVPMPGCRIDTYSLIVPHT